MPAYSVSRQAPAPMAIRMCTATAFLSSAQAAALPVAADALRAGPAVLIAQLDDERDSRVEPVAVELLDLRARRDPA